ncbi:PH domain-containing protein [Salinicoccus carnicancri]|uniref:PH domain-containing protein n=1 Tax=Salinicoccus carnicancri TaxID=558170 RepID=UPI0002ED4358|nr:PH domain-containing protein [Salinicoccus carnicancri]
MYNPEKLHPVAYLGSVVNAFKNLWIPIIVVLFNSREAIFSGNISLKYLLISGGVVIFAVVLFGGYDFLNKFRTRFWIEDGKFIYKDGVISNREKELDISRIQSIDFNEPIFHRIFGAVKLDIITPGEGIKIDTIKKSQAQSIQSILYNEMDQLDSSVEIGASSRWPREEAPVEDQPEQFVTLYQMTGKALILMSMTSGALGAFLAIVFGFINLIGANFLIERYFEVFEGLVQNIFLALGIAVLIFVTVGYIMGILILSIKYYNYTLKMKSDDLVVEYGLLEKKHRSVNVIRVQNIIIKDSIIRRIIGYYSLSVTITSDSLDSGEIDGKVELIPFIRKKRLYRIIDEIFPNYHVELPVRTVPFRGYRRYFQVMLTLVVIITGIVQYFWFGYAWIIGLAVAGIFIISGIYSARNTGYKFHGDEINMMTTGFFSRSHFVIKHEKVIQAEWVVNPFLRRADLGVITLVTAAGMVGSSASLKFIDKEDIEKIWNWAERGHSNGKDIAESGQSMEDQ